MGTPNQSTFNVRTVPPFLLSTPGVSQESAPAKPASTAYDATEKLASLRARALQDSSGSRALSKSASAPKLFEPRLKEISEVIRASCKVLQQRVVNGQKLQGEGRLLFEDSSGLKAALMQLEQWLGGAGEFPSIEANDAGTGETAPEIRTYAAIRNYFLAADFAFEKTGFIEFVNGWQERASFNLAECWALVPFAQFFLLERISEIAAQIQVQPDQSSQDGLSAAETANVASTTETKAISHLTALLLSLQQLAETDSKELFVEINRVEMILRADPSGAYTRMDFASRGMYCRAVAEMAKASKRSEEEVAAKAAELAKQAEKDFTGRSRERRSHVGFYLLAEGQAILRGEFGARLSLAKRAREAVLKYADFIYLTGIELATIGIIALILFCAKGELPTAVELLLFVLPAVECAVGIMNVVATQFVSPEPLAKLDFSSGIPAECTTMVAVPTLLISKEQTEKAVRDLEVRYLANRDPHLHFALLTDPPDAVRQFDEKDELAGFCASLIDQLNEKYARASKGSFFLFHRHRAWNASEKIWMGWERKRGKLLDFNNLLLGKSDSFPVKAGDMSVLPSVKYVITLDADTQLPRESAHRMIGAIAHPLQRAVVDPVLNRVVEGYGILQPRVEISIKSVVRSRLAAIFSGDTGFDIYTRAVSDVYQDLFREGIFTGKGIYELESFQQVLEHRFPCNALLSHDLIEGAYARAGLLSDVEVVDDYPSHFSAYSRRKHRWVRGDWQIIFWLLPRVPDFFGKIVRNPLNLISRWKIIDNLRRSLTEFATLLLLLAGWLFLPGNAVYWTVAVLLMLAAPSYIQFAAAILRAGPQRYRATFWKNLGADFAAANERILFRIAFLCHQGIVTLDAVVRTLIRLTITHKRLLEWETAAETEIAASRRKSPVETYLEWVPLIAFALGIVTISCRPASLPVALPFLALWAFSPAICRWLERPSVAKQPALNQEHEKLLRKAALRTWRFFREYSNADENWLIPDIVQETPPAIAHHISTTNLGFLLNARLAAYDLGVLTLPEMIAGSERTLKTIERMPRCKGHLYNWYDTRTLEPLKPRFVSTVDNGNFVCACWTLKQGCFGAVQQPLFAPTLRRGILEVFELIGDSIGHAGGKTDKTQEANGNSAIAPRSKVDSKISAAIQVAEQRLRELPASEAAWIEIMPEIEAEIVDADKKLSETEAGGELRWWLHELSLRLSSFSKLAQDFAPWLSPQLSKYYRALEIEDGTDAASLTLDSLPGVQSGLDVKLQKIAEDARTDANTGSVVAMLRSALSRASEITRQTITKIRGIADSIDELMEEMDFGFLYDTRKKLFSIGYDAEKNGISKYDYDLLASEARSAVFVAIAKGDAPQEGWLRLVRTHTLNHGARVLRSWSGTTFEYLLPSLYMRNYPGTILEHSARTAVRAQVRFMKGTGFPWGVSECSCAARNPDGFYTYYAYGVPGLALNPETKRDVVVSPYSSFLALQVDAASAAENMRKMEQMGWLGEYGFYEAADFTPSRTTGTESCTIVRCWMAHHQGMSLIAAANALCNGSIRKRFHQEPLVAATERLLHEKFPRSPVIERPENEKLSAAELLDFGWRRRRAAERAAETQAPVPAGAPAGKASVWASAKSISEGIRLPASSAPSTEDHRLNG